MQIIIEKYELADFLMKVVPRNAMEGMEISSMTVDGYSNPKLVINLAPIPTMAEMTAEEIAQREA